MPQEIVQCEECGREGPKNEIGVCGDWIGTVVRSTPFVVETLRLTRTPEEVHADYACPDIICPGCRTKDGHTHD